MKKALFILVVILFQYNCFSQSDILWQKSLGGSLEEYATSIQETIDGGYIVAGFSSSSDGDVTVNNGGSDYWIVKMDVTGTIQWQKAYGGSGLDSVWSIQQTVDGVYIVAGSTNSTDGDVIGNHGGYDGWVLKLNATGTIQWQKTLGGSNWDGASCIRQTVDGGYIVAGYTGSRDGDVTLNNGSTDYWVVKLNAIGTIQWQKSYGGSGGDYASSIQQSTDGGYIVTGSSSSYDGDVTGNHGSYDYWVVKLDATGTIQWQKSLGGSGVDDGNSIQQTADGGYIVAGDTGSTDYNVTGNHGGEDYWIVKLDSTGIIQWRKALGGSAYESLKSIQQTGDGGYIAAGVTYSIDGDVTGNHGGYDYWIVKLDSIGTIQWQKTLGGSGDDDGNSVQQTADGGYILAGWSTSTDGDVTMSNGTYDFWIVKLTADALSSPRFQKANVVMYPNPTKSILSIQLPNDMPIDKIIIIDISGKIIIEQTKNTTKVDTESLVSGMYIIQLISGGDYWQSEFLKE